MGKLLFCIYLKHEKVNMKVSFSLFRFHYIVLVLFIGSLSHTLWHFSESSDTRHRVDLYSSGVFGVTRVHSYNVARNR